MLPRAFKAFDTAVSQTAEIGVIETLVANQANDQRAFLLTGDDSFLAAFDRRAEELRTARAAAEALETANGTPRLAEALIPHERFVEHHREVVSLARSGRHADAVALAFGPGRDERLGAQRRLADLRRSVLARADADAAAANRRAVGLTGLLLGLGLVPAAGALVLARTLRRVEASEEAEEARRRLAEAQRIAHLGSWSHDLGTGAMTWSEEMFRILGLDPGEEVPSPDAVLARIHEDDRDHVLRLFGQGAEAASTIAFRTRIVRPGGEIRWVECQGAYSHGPDGSPASVVGTALDVTERHAAAEQADESRRALGEQAEEMRRRAFHDPLTGLPNRAMLLARLEEAIGDGMPHAVLLLDLDGFKHVNDSLGHAFGDRLLKRVGERLHGVAQAERDSASDRDVVARLGGDEFALVLHGVDRAEACHVADQILAAFAEPVRIDGRRLSLSASVGVVLPSWTASPTETLRDADVAMYTAKEAGGARHAVFDPAMRAAVVDRLALEAELRTAVHEGGLLLHYQPIVDPVTGIVDKVEALVRWAHPTRGVVAPDAFIPLAEETGLIVPLGAWVLRQACAEAARHTQRPDLRVAVNVSARQLEDPALVEMVEAALEDTGLAADRLVLEVTETIVMQDFADAADRLTRLRALGVGLAIDDFGTGYSSLSRLRLLPVDEVKIDKSFIDEIDDEGERATVIAAVIAMAQGLGRAVVAEGVETAAQLHALARLGCDRVQGYLMSKPLPAAELGELLAFRAPYAGLAEQGGEADHGDLEVMETVSRMVRTERGVAEVRSLLHELVEATGLECAYVTAIDFDRGVQRVLAAHGAGPPEGLEVDWEDSLCRRALASGIRVTSAVPDEFPDYDTTNVVTFAMAPLGDDGRPLGTLCAVSSTAVPVDGSVPALMDVFARVLAELLEDQTLSAPAPARDGTVRVVIADDSPVARALLRRFLAGDAAIEVVAEAADGAEAVEAAARAQPDVVLLDIEMPNVDGIDVIPRLRTVAPSAQVIVVAAEGEAHRARAVAAGAVDVLDKSAPPGTVRATVLARG